MLFLRAMVTNTDEEPPSLKLLILVQTIVTAMVLGFAAFVFSQSEVLATAIVSSILTHWFGEMKAIGRTAREERREAQSG